jgi:hypothetical protein
MLRTKARRKIIAALQLHPYLTTAQIARLFYSLKKDGQPSNSRGIKPRQKEYLLEPGDASARKILAGMLEDGLVVAHKPITATGKTLRVFKDLWSLNPKNKEDFGQIQFSKDLLPPPANFYNRDHEIDVGDVFVSLAKTRKLEHWDVGWDKAEKKSHGLFGANYDARAEIEGFDQVLFFEVDRGSEDIETLQNKVTKYKKLADANPGSPFIVVFTVQGYQGASARPRGEKILKEVLAPAKRGNLFLATPHKAFLADPLGPVLVPPYNQTTLLSFSDLS